MVNKAGLDLIKSFEGLRLEAYLCPAKVWTIGYGHTDGVKEGDIITEALAEVFLSDDLLNARRSVADLVEAELSDNQFAALVSLVFNIGAGAFADSTLLRKLNAGESAAVPDEFRRWCKVKGKVTPGLLRRRNAEVMLWLQGES